MPVLQIVKEQQEEQSESTGGGFSRAWIKWAFRFVFWVLLTGGAIFLVLATTRIVSADQSLRLTLRLVGGLTIIGVSGALFVGMGSNPDVRERLRARIKRML
ncbi:hypothetical protein [Streptomyces sp. NPDC020667]|uniref:hypothetical protein n=1 Tax=Streptomyces sp. NPDC020667 TaxID=3154895 RepID=UPI003402D0C1